MLRQRPVIAETIAAIQHADPRPVTIDGAELLARFMPDWARLFAVVPPEHHPAMFDVAVPQDRVSAYLAPVLALCAVSRVSPHPEDPAKVVAWSDLLQCWLDVSLRGVVEAPAHAGRRPLPDVEIDPRRLHQARTLRGGDTPWRDLGYARTGARRRLLDSEGAVAVAREHRHRLLVLLRWNLPDLGLPADEEQRSLEAIEAALADAAVPLRRMVPASSGMDTWFDAYAQRFELNAPFAALAAAGAVTQQQVLSIDRRRALALVLTGARVPAAWPRVGYEDRVHDEVMPVRVPVDAERWVAAFVDRHGGVLLPPWWPAPAPRHPRPRPQGPDAHIGLLGVDATAWPSLGEACERAGIAALVVLEALNALAVGAATGVLRRELAEGDRWEREDVVAVVERDDVGLVARVTGRRAGRVDLLLVWDEQAHGWLVVTATAHPPAGRAQRRRARLSFWRDRA